MTITQQQIIALAVEAGLAEVTDTAESLPFDYVEALARFAQLAAQQERNSRQAAQLELEQYRNEAQRRASLLIKEAYQRGVRDEREACAITAWNHYMDECRKKNVHPADFGEWCAASAIRSRSDK